MSAEGQNGEDHLPRYRFEDVVSARQQHRLPRLEWKPQARFETKCLFLHAVERMRASPAIRTGEVMSRNGDEGWTVG